MPDGFDCAQCGEYTNPTAYRPGTPKREFMESQQRCLNCAPPVPAASMTAPRFTGADDELDALMEEVDGPDFGKLFAWRDAAVARHLAEAGAVHPAVHTPARVMQWLGEHGWQSMAPARAEWQFAEWVDADARTVFVSLSPDVADYGRYTRYVVENAAEAAGVTVATALLEIATMPDEVAW